MSSFQDVEIERFHRGVLISGEGLYYTHLSFIITEVRFASPELPNVTGSLQTAPPILIQITPLSLVLPEGLLNVTKVTT